MTQNKLKSIIAFWKIQSASERIIWEKCTSPNAWGSQCWIGNILIRANRVQHTLFSLPLRGLLWGTLDMGSFCGDAVWKQAIGAVQCPSVRSGYGRCPTPLPVLPWVSSMQVYKTCNTMGLPHKDLLPIFRKSEKSLQWSVGHIQQCFFLYLTFCKFKLYYQYKTITNDNIAYLTKLLNSLHNNYNSHRSPYKTKEPTQN